MLDQALDAAERLGQREQFAALEETPRVLDSTLEFDRDHAAEGALSARIAHLCARQHVLRMRGQPG